METRISTPWVIGCAAQEFGEGIERFAVHTIGQKVFPQMKVRLGRQGCVLWIGEEALQLSAGCRIVARGVQRLSAHQRTGRHRYGRAFRWLGDSGRPGRRRR